MDEELLGEFLIESNENMAAIEQQLMDLEANPGDASLLDAIFRTVHTVKGSCGFIGLKRLEKVAHAGENVLGKMRSTRYPATPEIVSMLLECADAIQVILDGLQANNAEPEVDHSGLIRRLTAAERLIGMTSPGDTAAESPAQDAPAEGSPSAAEASSEGSEDPATEQPVMPGPAAQAGEDWLVDFSSIREALAAAGLSTPADVLKAGFNGIKAIEGVEAAVALKLLGVAKSTAAALPAEAKQDDSAVNEEPVDAACNEAVNEPQENAKPEPVAAKPAAPPANDANANANANDNDNVVTSTDVDTDSSENDTPQAAAPAAGRAQPAGKAPESIRVDVAVLDALMNQVGELVLTRNRLLQLVSASGGSMRHAVKDEGTGTLMKSLVPISRDINHITESLQDRLLQTRMQPISTIWGTVPRIVRDMGRQLNKKINVVMEGQETELDRTILAALKDPLTHIIRNSCDHGIEMPSERMSCGKSEFGTLSLRASQEAGSILITISDDGGGIDADRVKDKAVTMGVLTKEAARAMSDEAALQLIFHPGLSTAKKVSNISGRGVGMDVVKNAIEKAGGSVDIESDMFSGTTLRIRIPLTMAIISAMLVRTAGQMFAVPQMSVQELLAAPKDSGNWCRVAGQDFFRLRGNLLPVVRLTDSLGLPPGESHGGSIVVVHAGNRRIGIQVDAIVGAEELVVKPLGMHFRDIGVFGGCSILGDGSVVPILECNGVVQSLRLSGEAETAHTEAARGSGKSSEEMQHTLVFRGMDQLYAIPMMLVERLESLLPGRIEHSGGREVLQYRGDIIPVLRWNRLLGGEPSRGEEDCCLIIADNGKRMCLHVDAVEDILQTPLRIEMKSREPLFLGTSVIHEQSTEVVDVFELLRLADPDWFALSRDSGGKVRRSILFAEDAPFFRTMLIPVLESLNYEVWYARDGEEARDILCQRVPDVILTDLEMPRMTGYQLAEWVRAQDMLAEVPVIAISSAPPAENDSERRRHFHAVLGKMDRQGLTRCLGELHDAVPGEPKASFERPVLVGGRPS